MKTEKCTPATWSLSADLMKEKRIQINTDISIAIDMVGYLECPQGWVGKEHSHHFWEILLSTRDFSNFEVSVIVPNERHLFENHLESTMYYVYIGFHFGSAENVDTEYQRRVIEERLLMEENMRLYKFFYEEIRKHGDVTAFKGTLLMDVMLLVAKLVDTRFFRDNLEEADQIGIVMEVKKYINRNIGTMCTVNEIADSLYMSPKYVGSIFKKRTGEGILQYQRRKKMEKALAMLRGEQYLVKEVAQYLGFDNLYYFSNVFKSYYGMSPTYFIKQYDRKDVDG